MQPTAMKIRHLQRDVASALELALVAPAPNSLIESLAASCGLLSALSDLPLDRPQLALWASESIARAERSLTAWRAWDAERGATA